MVQACREKEHMDWVKDCMKLVVEGMGNSARNLCLQTIV